MTMSEDLQLSIPPHPEDADFLEELRRIAFLACNKFDVPLTSVAHKALPGVGVGDALCYESKRFIRLTLRHKNKGKWAEKPLARKIVIENLGWFLPTLMRKEAHGQAKPRAYIKKLRKEITDFLLDNWVVGNLGFIDKDEVNSPVI